jgi:hypothetical protein
MNSSVGGHLGGAVSPAIESQLAWRGRIGRTLWFVRRLSFSTLGQPARRPVGVWHQYRLGRTIGRDFRFVASSERLVTVACV